MIGRSVSHYEILERIGGGGMGVVYKARDTKLDRHVALKFLPPHITPDPDTKERFIQEARAASLLDHPSICTIHGTGETEEGQLFIVMACYEGENLKAKIERAPLEIDTALDIAIQVASGLSRAHEAGITHRDIKPANIMLTQRGEVKILDFGLAKLSGQTMLTKVGSTVGTAAYMSPEQAKSEPVDGRTDVWSLGVVLYEMLTGRRPFESDYEQALIYAILNEEPRPIRKTRPEVPEVVEQIVARAMAKEKGERYQTVDEFLSDLKVARGTADSGGTIAVAAEIERKRRKKRFRTVAIAAAVVVCAGVGMFIVAPLLQDQTLASNPTTIAFISFDNSTGDKSLDNLQSGIPSLLATSLDESKYFRVMRWDQIHGVLRQMGKEDVPFVDTALGLAVCRRVGVHALGFGSFTKAGKLFRTDLRILDVNSGKQLIQSLRADGQGAESILMSQVDELARQVSRGLGVSRWSTASSLKPVQQLTTVSLEACNFYMAGEAEFNRLHFIEAVRDFELAVKADSTFALAWHLLGVARSCVAHIDSVDRSGIKLARDKAVRYASRVPERELWHIAVNDTGLQVKLTGVPVKDWSGYWRRCLERFPDDARAHQELSLQLLRQRRYDEAIRHATTAAPTIVLSWNTLAYMYMYAGQPDKAIEAAKQYAHYAPGESNTFHTMGECFRFAGRFDEAVDQFQKALAVSPVEYLGSSGIGIGQLRFHREEYDEALDWFKRAGHSWWQAFTLFWLGRLKEAERELDKMPGDRLAEWLKIWIAYEREEGDSARVRAQRWARLYPPPEEDPEGWMFIHYCQGLVDLKQGKTDSVETRLATMASLLKLAGGAVDSVDLERERNFYGNTLRAAHFLATGRVNEIASKLEGIPVRWFQDERGHGVASRPAHSWTWFGWRDNASTVAWVPVPADIVPQAYLKRGMLDSAITAYEWAVDRNIDYLCPIVPRYHYRLAKLYEEKGMKEKAIAQYTQFLKTWGKADPIYMEPADARMRLAILRSR